jgi:deltex
MRRARLEGEQGQHGANNAGRVATMGQLAPSSHMNDNGGQSDTAAPSRLTHDSHQKRPKIYHETRKWSARWSNNNTIGQERCQLSYSDGNSGHSCNNMDVVANDEQNGTHTGLLSLSSSHIARRVSFSPTVIVKNTVSSSAAAAAPLLDFGIPPVSLDDPLWNYCGPDDDHLSRCISPVVFTSCGSSTTRTRAIKSTLAPDFPTMLANLKQPPPTVAPAASSNSDLSAPWLPEFANHTIAYTPTATTTTPAAAARYPSASFPGKDDGGDTRLDFWLDKSSPCFDWDPLDLANNAAGQEEHGNRTTAQWAFNPCECDTDANDDKRMYRLLADDEDDRKPAAVPRDSGHADAIDGDWEMARRLQEEEYCGIREEERLMMNSVTGRAWKFVEQVMELHKNLACSTVQPIAVDDMVYVTERMLLMQQEFRSNGKPTIVDLGYHYTDSQNLSTIRSDGLMNRAERRDRNVGATRNRGSLYGHGIYAATNPSAFNGTYGDVGLLVARLYGFQGDHPLVNTALGAGNDSLVVFRGYLNEFMVLPSSKQCIPVFQFQGSSIQRFAPDAPGNASIYNYHVRLQQLIDYAFNGGSQTTIHEHVRGPFIPQNSLSWRSVSTTRPFIYSDPGTEAYNAYCSAMGIAPYFSAQAYPNTSLLNCSRQFPDVAVPPDTIQYVAPNDLRTASRYCYRKVKEGLHSVLSNECMICLEPLMCGIIAKLNVCGHMFHRSCVAEALAHNPMCPTCRAPTGKPQGRMPSGSMSVHRSARVCAGFETVGTLVIAYNIPSDMQKSYHLNPGMYHGNANRTAYLPDTPEGNALLKRLKFAFQHGLTFAVGVSMSSGLDNSVTWGSIHHKTSCSGGARSHGYPDPHYFDNCNKELDALHVPQASDML